MDLKEFGTALAIIISLVSLYKAWRQLPHEESNTDADTVIKFEEAANKAAERSLKLHARLTEVEEELEKAKKTIVLLQQQIDNISADKELLADWVERLSHQVQSLGEKPVPIRESPSRPRSNNIS